MQKITGKDGKFQLAFGCLQRLIHISPIHRTDVEMMSFKCIELNIVCNIQQSIVASSALCHRLI